MKRCFLFKPDGIGDFFLVSGVIRFLGRELGERNLTIAVLPVMESVVRGQFPEATCVTLPIIKKRVILNVFAANCLRCFRPWLSLLGTRADLAISLRHMRDYLMNVLFYSVPAGRRVVVENMLLGNGRPVRRWTERVFLFLFRQRVLSYPEAAEGVPRELEACRRLVSEALGRNVTIGEVWPDLRRVGDSPIKEPYWICAPFANGGGKDFPVERWAELFSALHAGGKTAKLLLTGSRDQAERLHSFRQSLDPGVASRTEIMLPATLQDFIDLLAGAGLVFTVDTAAAHAATALDCRTLVLFSGQHHGTYGPWVRSPRQCWMHAPGGGREQPWHESLATSAILRNVEEILALE